MPLGPHDKSQIPLLSLIGVVTVAGVVGAVMANDRGVQGIISLCTLIVTYLLGSLRAEVTLSSAAAETKAALQERSAATDAKLARIESGNEAARVALDTNTQITSETKELVNGSLGNSLRLTATVSRRLATLTGHPADNEAADLAERTLREHEAKNKGTRT